MSLYGSASKTSGLYQAPTAFCDEACSRIGSLATNPPCDEPIEDYNTPRTARVCNTGPATKIYNRGGRGAIISIVSCRRPLASEDDFEKTSLKEP